ncbi:MaoC family dehydratase [Thermaerobacter sp. PB12/4term]|uniref:MaoC family dehydratase N-terminal domain-containing protein n=1 Tax=Thermaerobacter sp. PB12/4term TaxID=2293838 RepID=UPI000E3283EB|nr:MaoC family dehydratase N-terminal domain-containing protein [Thermaerobacter sp. PB12/4term]QIA27649.1 MaoC family dehydratase [Thermaerobacter sp. PB12/4term]
MAIDRSLIGKESPEEVFEVERGAIRKFAEAIGDPHPAFRSGEIAPPTFPTTFRMGIPGVNLELSRVLHGEQEYSYRRPIRAGDRLRCKSRVADVYEREGRLGKMTFLVTEIEGRDEAGELVFTGRSTVIVR